MTTPKTSDAEATAAQAVALARAGCEIVRVTVPSKADAEALPRIRAILKEEKIFVPLVADIHFSPRIAEMVVPFVEKVRINPGNFADKKKFEVREYSDTEWQEEIERVYALFAPVVDRAVEYGVALRIGVNHGSLSDRIVNRFGDSPAGMAESALEFVRIAEDRGHRDLVISLKSSNTQVMTRAYREMSARLGEGDSSYPFHLGVTEAGDGISGRIKSAAGIALCLSDGLGDTVRVSLTEDPLAELPVAQEIVRRFARPLPEDDAASTDEATPVLLEARNPLDPTPRSSASLLIGSLEYGGTSVPRVELQCLPSKTADWQALASAFPPPEVIDLRVGTESDGSKTAETLDAVRRAGLTPALTLDGDALEALQNGAPWAHDLARRAERLAFVLPTTGVDHEALLAAAGEHPLLLLFRVGACRSAEEAHALADAAVSWAGRRKQMLMGIDPLIGCDGGGDIVQAYRALAAGLDVSGSRVPIVLFDARGADDDLIVASAGRLAGLLLDGIGDAVRVVAGADPASDAACLHEILQASRRRLEKAEFIACPSCGRTLFDLEETTARVRALTSHLKLKIAVMGCVVNGPGEMADADFGYVGWGPGRVALFVRHEMVERDIPQQDAPARLVDLIKSRGAWNDPPGKVKT